jgi:hypothetical protein
VNVGSFGYLTVGSTDNNGITPTENSFPYLVEFIESATGVIPPPISDQTTYDYILHHLEEFQATGSSETVDFFDANHISNPDLMRFRF